LQNQFEKLGIKLLVVSTDPLETHDNGRRLLRSLITMAGIKPG